MMKIKIVETGEIETLSMMQPGNGCDWSEDFIGNAGGFEKDFVYDHETGIYTAEQETFNWWDKVVSAHRALEERIYDLKQEHGSDAVHEAIGDAGNTDLEDMPAAINAALDAAFGE